jgi:hypothetical protein
MVKIARSRKFNDPLTQIQRVFVSLFRARQSVDGVFQDNAFGYG